NTEARKTRRRADTARKKACRWRTTATPRRITYAGAGRDYAQNRRAKGPGAGCRGLLGASLGALGAAVTGRNRRDGASVYRFCRCSMMNQITTMRPINESKIGRAHV